MIDCVRARCYIRNPQMTRRVQIQLLGRFEVHVDGKAVPIRTKKAQALLAFLALNPDNPVPRSRIAEMLWEGAGSRHARHSLRQTLVGLRRTFGEHDAANLLYDAEDLVLDERVVEVDALRFLELAAAESSRELLAAMELYRGDILEGVSLRESAFDEWLEQERTRFREQAKSSFRRLLDIQRDDGGSDDAIATATRLLAIDPLQEPVHRALMELYVETGKRESALRQFETCRTILARQLGVEPEPATRELYLTIREPGDSSDSRPASRPAILVVEDDPESRVLLEKLLGSESYEVISAGDGEEALRKLDERRFDVVLSDIRMPNLNGLELLKAMSKRGIATPVVFLTALREDVLEIKGLKLGASDFIRKPIRPDILLLRVRNAIRRGREMV